MSGDIKFAIFGWVLIIIFVYIKFFYRKSQKQKKDQKEKILYFKNNQGAYEFALMSLPNGFGTMNFWHAGIIKGKAFDKKKEIKKITGDTEKVINEISKYKLKVAYRGKEIEVVGNRTDNLSATKKLEYEVGDLVAVTDLSHSIMNKISGIERKEGSDYQFEIMNKIKPVFNATKMDFEK
jgi:hypothetical protein